MTQNEIELTRRWLDLEMQSLLRNKRWGVGADGTQVLMNDGFSPGDFELVGYLFSVLVDTVYPHGQAGDHPEGQAIIGVIESRRVGDQRPVPRIAEDKLRALLETSPTALSSSRRATVADAAGLARQALLAIPDDGAASFGPQREKFVELYATLERMLRGTSTLRSWSPQTIGSDWNEHAHEDGKVLEVAALNRLAATLRTRFPPAL